MKGKDKKGKTGFSDFQSYAEGKMSNMEKNAFERDLQKDPFAEEAAEGLDLISAGEAADDMSNLKKRLSARTSRKVRINLYRIAASIAVLMILSSVYLIVRQTNNPGKINIAAPEQPFEITETVPVRKSEATEAEKKMTAEEQEGKIKGAGQPSEVAERENRSADSKQINEAKIAEAEKTIGAKDISVMSRQEKIAVPSAAVKAFQPNEITVRGKIVSSEDNLPLTGASVSIKGTNKGAVTDMDGKFSLELSDKDTHTLVANYIGMETKEFQASDKGEMEISLKPSSMALDEVVVVGYGAKKNAGATGAIAGENEKTEEAGYIPPQPEYGQNNFDKYIEDNIRKPESLSPGKRAVVVINFTVHATGLIDSVRVIRSPGDEFSQEAVRLIRNGPSWKPATENGKSIDDEVRVRIVFRKD